MKYILILFVILQTACLKDRRVDNVNDYIGDSTITFKLYYRNPFMDSQKIILPNTTVYLMNSYTAFPNYTRSVQSDTNGKFIFENVGISNFKLYAFYNSITQTGNDNILFNNMKPVNEITNDQFVLEPDTTIYKSLLIHCFDVNNESLPAVKINAFYNKQIALADSAAGYPGDQSLFSNECNNAGKCFKTALNGDSLYINARNIIGTDTLKSPVTKVYLIQGRVVVNKLTLHR